jgi:site-specific DNA-methyltransferase (adenine-specific)
MINSLEANQVYHFDLFELCATMPSQSVDMILCDLPYGTTACAWDEVIPFKPMWDAFKRLLKPERVIVLTASQPFTTKLIASNITMFRYEWIWIKTNGGGFLNANRQPLKRHENILVFYERSPIYEPQMVKGKPYRTRRASAGETTQDQTVAGWVTDNDGSRFPTSILEFVSETGLHPTQKPVDLFRYLIRTYTLPGELVFDPCVGSGTTAIAAREENRTFIVGDSSLEYVQIARDRLRLPFENREYAPPNKSLLKKIVQIDGVEMQQTTMFED